MPNMRTDGELGTQANGYAGNGNGWRHLCERLVAERDQHLARIALLTEENKQLKRSICHMLYKGEQPIDAEAVLAEFGKEPPLEELIRELEES